MKPTLLGLLLFGPLLAASPPVVMIRNARIVPVSGPEIAGGSVVIRDGLIEAVGAKIAEPSDAWIMEGAGFTVYPGLIDALSKWALPQTPLQPGTHTFPYIRAADQLAPDRRQIEAARGAGFTSAAVFPDQGIFGGHGAIINLSDAKPGEMVVHPSAGMHIALRASGRDGAFPNSLMGVFAHIRQVYLDAAHYRAAKEYYDANPKGNRRPAYDRTLEGVTAAGRVLLPAAGPKDVVRMLSLAAELNLNPVLYGLAEGYRSAELLKNIPVLVDLRWPQKAANANPDLPEPLRVLDVREKAPSTPAVLAKAQVRFAFFARGLERPADMSAAVRKARVAGLSEADAIRALTLSAAEIYGVADRLGSIEPGKIANLVVTKGGLFEEKTEIRFVFVDGVRHEPK
ncbi:MAG: amidohydrolase family protein [Bryobacteraceae bacterium]|nr:amidohydrolase family protein [Bryobacteraceae bacterium]